VHLVGFTIEIHYDAQSYKYQTWVYYLQRYICVDTKISLVATACCLKKKSNPYSADMFFLCSPYIYVDRVISCTLSQQRYQVLSHVIWRLDSYWILIPGNTALAVFIERPWICRTKCSFLATISSLTNNYFHTIRTFPMYIPRDTTIKHFIVVSEDCADTRTKL